MFLHKAYSRFPYAVPPRVKFFNLFRNFFRIPPLERFLVKQLEQNPDGFWRRSIPPLYFYPDNSLRTATRDGVVFRLDISRLIDHWIYFHSMKNKSLQNLFRFIKPDFTVLDIGTNLGYVALTCAQLCKQGKVYAFEPDTENYAALQQNLALNPFTNVKTFQVALGATAAEGALYKLYSINPGANRILAEAPVQSVGSERVEIKPLDAFKRDGTISKADVLKIDVEGFEIFVLQGAREVLEAWKPLLFVEVAEVNLRQQQYTALDLIRYLESLDYTVLDAATLKAIDLTEENMHVDALCFPNTKPLTF
ncbi:FkbM family methyltransferase [Chryseolinea lacunae]|uniref:FkbM family methyltransferase n=1 Tax=Chryseolinea lacunae TaxID=2801331 RepID=A0ABS1KSE0_9BACT|nr:FkbM family methyltransferase [Chryseolinea lacunae]MBL0742265.1 FkbM family methyltransferase [Chryseolinea lacunae]